MGDEKQGILNLKVRPATADDYKAILEINKSIYGGFDYLPDLFYWMLHTPDNHPFVAVLDHNVVAFNNYRLINNGEAVLTMASRVAPGYQGLGINEKMKMDINRFMSKLYPSLSVRTWTSLGSAAQDRYFEKHKDKFQQLFNWIFVHGVADVKTLQQADLQTKCCTLSLSSALSHIAEIKQLILNHTSHILYVEYGPWCTLKLNDTNLRHVIRTNDVIGSFEEGSDRRHLSGISFMATMKASSPSAVAGVCYYGSSATDMIDHLKMAVQKICQVIPADSDVGMAVHVPSSLSRDTVVGFISSLFKLQMGNGGRNDGHLTSVKLEV